MQGTKRSITDRIIVLDKSKPKAVGVEFLDEFAIVQRYKKNYSSRVQKLDKTIVIYRKI